MAPPWCVIACITAGRCVGAADKKDAESKPQPERGGGISRDAQGNAVWQWAVDSGRHLMESTSLLLKRLEVPGLKLEDEAGPQDKKIDPQSGMPTESPGNAGYDPYGRRRVTAPAAARAAATRPKVTKPAAAPRP